MIIHEFAFKSKMTNGERLVLDHLNDLYKNIQDDRSVWIIFDHPIGYSGDSPGKPDFIVIDSKMGISVLEVKDCYEGSISELTTSTIKYKNDDKTHKNPVAKVDDYLNLVQDLLANYGATGVSGKISTHLIFTNIKVGSLTQEFLSDRGKSGLSRLHYKNQFHTKALKDIFYRKKELGEELSKKVVSILRPYLVFESNESKIDDQQNRSEMISMLDEKQLKAVRSNPIGHYLVTGIPGSGKSVAVCNRAIYLLTQKPSWRILVLCYNSPLKERISANIESRIHRLEKTGLNCANIEVMTLHKRCFNIAKKNNVEVRGTTVYERCENAVQIALEHVTKDYDAVLIDEYQDFNDDWIKIALGSAKMHKTKEKNEESLFMAGDRLQQIKEKGMSSTWSELGVHVVSSNRSFLLKVSYRTCKKQLTTALKFLMEHAALKKDVDKFYEGDHDLSFELDEFEGELMTSSRNWSGAYQEVISYIDYLIKKKVSSKDIMIIAPSGKVINDIKQELSCSEYRGVVIETPGRVKGLEAPYVFILNANWIVGDLRIGEVNRRKLMYMCLTRSNYFTYLNVFKRDNPITEELFDIINISEEEEAA